MLVIVVRVALDCSKQVIRLWSSVQFRPHKQGGLFARRIASACQNEGIIRKV